jgi:hypothetical protein
MDSHTIKESIVNHPVNKNSRKCEKLHNKRKLTNGTQ